MVQYPMQFNGPPRNIATHVQHRFAPANGGSADTTSVAFRALLLPSKYYEIMSRVPYLFYGRNIHCCLPLPGIDQ